MKRLICQVFVIAGLAAGASLNALAAPPAGQVDFGKFAEAAAGGELVEVQVSSNMLSMAARLVDKQEPELGKLLRSVQLIHINVIGLTEENRAEMEKRMQRIRRELDAQGWERIVTAQKKSGDDVAVFARTRGEEALAGLAITVFSPKKGAVLANIVGDIRPDQVAALGEKLNIEPLKQLGAMFKK